MKTMQTHRIKGGGLVVCLLALAGIVQAELPTKLLQKTDLKYKGSFRVPEGDLSSGGTALAVGPTGNSLYITTRAQKTAEISIPTIRNSNKVSDLAKASVIQSFADATEGKLASINPGDPNAKVVGGALVYGSKLLLTGSTYYDAEGSQVKSHFVSGHKLSTTGDIKGPYQVGTVGAGFVSGYMGLVPPEWQSAFGYPAVTGQCCIPIISRTSAGPSLSLFDPTKLETTNPVPAVPLLYYDIGHQNLGAYGAAGSNPIYNGASTVAGVVWASGTSTVLFIGTHGLGPWCYGDGGDCGDRADGTSKGVHAYPYGYQIWAYNVLDLLSVKNGAKKPWEIKPYTVWSFNLPFEEDDLHQIGGIAYDPATQRVYISQLNKDQGQWGYAYLPVIHVFEIDASPAPVVVIPTPPTNPVDSTPTPPPATPGDTVKITTEIHTVTNVEHLLDSLSTYEAGFMRYLSEALRGKDGQP